MKYAVSIDESTRRYESTNAFYLNQAIHVDGKTIDIVFGPKTKNAFIKFLDTLPMPSEIEIEGFVTEDKGKGKKLMACAFERKKMDWTEAQPKATVTDNDGNWRDAQRIAELEEWLRTKWMCLSENNRKWQQSARTDLYKEWARKGDEWLVLNGKRPKYEGEY